jgi:hypothetical protein
MSSQQRHHSTPGGFFLSNTDQVIERTWYDERGDEWVLCDACDAPAKKGEWFFASVMDYRIDEAGAYYCRRCAEDIVADWSARMVPFEDDE